MNANRVHSALTWASDRGTTYGWHCQDCPATNVWAVCGTPVVLVNGYAGGIALTHIERRLVDQIQTARPEAEVKAEGIREAAEIWREIARNSHTRDGVAEATERADWLDEHANHLDPRRLEGAHP